MTTLMRGQFFEQRQTRDDKDPAEELIIGWTIIHVESGYRSDEPGRQDHGLARVVIIRNDTRTDEPAWRNYQDVVDLIDSADWYPVSAPRKSKVDISCWSESEAAACLAEQDERLTQIQPLIDLGRDLYFDHTRTPVLHSVAEAHNISTPGVWQLLCLYWQFGNNPEGLRRRNSLAGQKPLAYRTANPKTFRAYKTGPRPSAESDAGIPMELADVHRCRRGARAFLFVPSPDHRLLYGWTHAWEQTLLAYYDRERNPLNPAPSLRQFETAVRSDPKFDSLSQRIVGPRVFATDHRPLTDTSRSGVKGSGHTGQIDDVTTKVILVDEITRLPLGQGRFFALSDVYSGIIAGAHDTLEGSSFAESTECLFNAFSDKAAFKKEQGMDDLDLHFHPCKGVFSNIIGDGGPFGGSLADNIPSSLCNVSNTAGYRPDFKSDIESSFHAYLVKVARHLPGYSPRQRRRGDRDPKIIAALTPRQFRDILWAWITIYNQRALVRWLPIDALKSKEPPDPVPWQIWNWGLEHAGGHLHFKTEIELRRALLPKNQAVWQKRRGVRFKGLTYVPPKEHQASGVFISRKVEVYYDRKYVRRIFVDLAGVWIPFELRKDLDQEFGHLTFTEIEHNHSRLNARRRAVRTFQRPSRIKLLSKVNRIMKESKDAALDRFHSERRRRHATKTISISTTRRKSVANERKTHATKVERLFDAATSKPATKVDRQAKAASKAQAARRLSTLELLATG